MKYRALRRSLGGWPSRLAVDVPPVPARHIVAETAPLIDGLLTTMGAAHLTQLIVESVHTQADHLAMAGRADEALALRRYARVILGAARELATDARAISEDRGV